GAAPGGDAQPLGERALGLQAGVDLQPFAVHDVRAGQSGGGHPLQHGGGLGAELGGGGRRRGGLHQGAGGLLQQQAGGAAVVVADHLGGLREVAGAVDAGQFQGAPAGQHRVHVEEVQGGGDAVQDRPDRVGADRLVAEGVGVQAPAAQPGAGGQVPDAGGERRAHRLQVGAAGQVDAPGALGAGERVAVPVDQAGGDHRALHIDHGGRRAGQGADPAVVAEVADPPVRGGQGGVRQEPAGSGVEQAGGEQDQVG